MSQDAKQIRKNLKSQLGYNARQVSVKIESYSMGETIHFTIRDASVDYAAVKAFAAKCESIDRCSYSGEILSGGNTYVDVSIKSEVATIWSAPFVSQIRDAYARLKSQITDSESRSFGIPVNDALLIWFDPNHAGCFHLTKRGEQMRTPYRVADDWSFERSALDAFLMLNA